MASRKADPKQQVRTEISSIRNAPKRIGADREFESNVKHRHFQELRTQQATECDQNIAQICEIPVLSDACLLAIFSFLSIKDLFEVGNCSRHFRSLADIVAPNLCEREIFHLIDVHKTHHDCIARYAEFMRNIIYERHEISQLFNDGTPESTWMWLRRCASLKKLTIINESPFYDQACASIYDRLEYLAIVDCSDGAYQCKLLIEACTKLKRIEFQNCPHAAALLDSIAKLTNIEKISSRSTATGVATFLTPTYLQQLTKLKWVRIDLSRYGRRRNNALPPLIDISLKIAASDYPNFSFLVVDNFIEISPKKVVAAKQDVLPTNV